MILSCNEHFLISTAMDGSLCIWKIFCSERNATKASKEIRYTNEVLIDKDELEEKVQEIENLTVRITELETEYTYKIRQLETHQNEKMREIHQGYCQTIEELKNAINKLKDVHKHELNSITIDIEKLKESHKREIQQLEINYDSKLITEYARYQELEERNNIMRHDYENYLHDFKKEKMEGLKQTVSYYEVLLHKTRTQLEESQDEVAYQAQIREHVTSQLEDETDNEIIKLQSNYETLLHKERETNLKLKSEISGIKNRYIASQKDIEDLKNQIRRVYNDYDHFQKLIQEREEDVIDLKRKITERDVTIHDKEQQIYGLKRTNQELAKFKLVLSYKICELKEQIEPRYQETKELKEKVHDMEVELTNLHKINICLELQIQELRAQLDGVKCEIQNKMQKQKKCQQLLKQIRIDLLGITALMQEPRKLNAAVTKLHHKYSADDILEFYKEDSKAQCEFSRQRNYLERTIISLKKQAHTATSSDAKNLISTDNENVTLSAELNALRLELTTAQKHMVNAKSLLQLKENDVSPAQHKQSLEVLHHANDELKSEHKIQMQHCQRVIAALQDDMEKLLMKIL